MKSLGCSINSMFNWYVSTLWNAFYKYQGDYEYESWKRLPNNIQEPFDVFLEKRFLATLDVADYFADRLEEE